MAGSPVLQPRINIQLLEARIAQSFGPRRDVIVGQKGASGSATDKVVVNDVHLMTESDIITQFGDDYLYWTIRNWRRGANVDDGGFVPVLDVIPVDANGSGVAATATIAFAGTATAAGTYVVDVVDERNFRMTVNIASGTTANQAATALAAAVSNLTRAPFSAAASTNTVTYTASDVGTGGNYYGIRISGTVAGLTPTLTGWSGGANDPTLTDAIDGIDGTRYTALSWPEAWQGSLNVPVDEMDSRFNTAGQLMDGTVFTGHTDTFANDRTFVDTRNTQVLQVMGNNILANADHDGPAVLHPADWAATYFMAVRDKRLSTGALVARDLVAPAPLDATGGAALASLPYFNTPLREVPVTAPANLFSQQEMDQLALDGFTTYGVNSAGNTMIMNTAVTTRTTDAAGNVNDSFRFLNYVDTGSVCREIFFNELRATYSQTRLTEGNLIDGRSVTNEGAVRAELDRIYDDLAALALVQDSREARQTFRNQTIVDIDLASGLVTIAGPLPIVTQLRGINYNLQLSFNVGDQ